MVVFDVLNPYLVLVFFLSPTVLSQYDLVIIKETDKNSIGMKI